ncbi:MAG: NAD(P)-binding protein, partial [Planctomycetota bacterium]|nr:NAD(P)-binding protein [Planctomycetota bacterium]
MAVERYDTLIIGAGMSGLAAGIRLAQYDRPVVILERHYLWGGLNSFYKRAGRRIDVGMHALTNYVPPKTTGTPLAKILRQLRLRHEDLKLGEQHHSEILFPGERLTFTNDFGHLEAEVARAFPRAADAFRRLAAEIRAYELRSED